MMRGASFRGLRLALAGAAAALSLLGAFDEAYAQAGPGVAAGVQTPITRVLAVGSLTQKATDPQLREVLGLEVPATLKLYLAGKIDAWFAKSDHTGVVFILNVTTVEEARALLDPLPLGQAGMMTFQFTPLGPLQPLGLLLRGAAK